MRHVGDAKELDDEDGVLRNACTFSDADMLENAVSIGYSSNIGVLYLKQVEKQTQYAFGDGFSQKID